MTSSDRPKESYLSSCNISQQAQRELCTQSKRGITLSALGYLVDCLKFVYNYYTTIQQINQKFSVITDIFKIFRLNENRPAPLPACPIVYSKSNKSLSTTASRANDFLPASSKSITIVLSLISTTLPTPKDRCLTVEPTISL